MTDTFSIKKGPLVIALMTVVFLAAMEITITVLAAPAITRQLAGFDLMSFMFSSYLLAGAVTTPVFGRLADLYGRKRMLSLGIVIFLVGSALCGAAQSMAMLIAFRTIQGAGAGSIFTLAYTIVGDAFPIESRAAIMGAMSSVWGIAGFIGPVIGGFLIEGLSWHWVFFINIPFGVAGLAILKFSLTENFCRETRQKRRADWSGLVTRTIVFVNAIAFLACAAMQGIDVYIALYLQNVLGHSAMIAGLAVLPMCFSWGFVSYIMGKLLTRFNGKVVVILAGVVQLACAALFVTLDASSGLPFVVVLIFLTGFGLGGLITATTIIIQESVGYDKRGTAMGISSFVKTMGQTVGIAVLGMMLNMRLVSFFAEAGLVGVDLDGLLQEGGGVADALGGAAASALAGPGGGLVVQALDTGINLLFWIMLAATAALLALALFMPNIYLGKETEEEAPA
ncbi:MAG: MFS transporter [Coriobacteriaceae bacterium]|jgi:MFS family permease|nr:MFS transporter [Coriobacteriaceae bacterium]